MDTVMQMLQSHPRREQVDVEQYAQAMTEFATCEIVTTLCADACLSEPHVQMLAKCIALNLDCADSCATTARALGRIGFAEQSVIRSQIEACREACRACADECERHTNMEHCHLCAAMCRSCERLCATLLEGMMAFA